MRAGQMDRVITIETPIGGGVDEYRNPTTVWKPVATLRAQIIQANTEEFLKAFGETQSVATIFRTRFLDGLTTAHRVRYNGQPHNIRELKELGRRRGWEIRTEAAQ